jgi:hypothetical protein
MKKPLLLPALLAAGVLLGGAATASAEDGVLVRQSQALACLSAGMEDEFGASLRAAQRHRSPTRAELGLRESLCQLAGITAQFRRQVDRCGAVEDLERGCAAMREAFACASECTRGVAMPTHVRGMLQQYGQALACVEHLSFEAFARATPEHFHHHHHRAGPPATSSHGIYFRVPATQAAPFVFRQPLH